MATGIESGIMKLKAAGRSITTGMATDTLGILWRKIQSVDVRNMQDLSELCLSAVVGDTAAGGRNVV